MQEFGLDGKVLQEIISVFKKYEQIESAKIFGSRARGDYRKASELTLLYLEIN